MAPGIPVTIKKTDFFISMSTAMVLKIMWYLLHEDASYGAKFDPNLMVYQWDAFDPASPYYKKARPWVAAENDPSTFYETSVFDQ